MSKEAGVATVEDPDSGPVLIQATYQCVHCGAHFHSRPDLLNKVVDSMKQGGLTREESDVRVAQGRNIRGFCTNCMGPVCGPGCAECVPTEQLLENYEKGRPLNFRPTIVSVPAAVPSA